MDLAWMISVDEDALVCDFAEVYRVYDLRALPAVTAAVLACGLRDDSRIKMKMAGMQHLPAEIILVRIHDLLVTYALGRAGKKPKKRDMLANEMQVKPAKEMKPENRKEVKSRRSLFVKG